MVTNDFTLEQAHVVRSRLIDAYAIVELEIKRLLVCAKVQCGSEPLGQKLEKLKLAKAAPQYPKAKKAEVAKHLELLAPLLEIRADVVHSPLRLEAIDGVVRATFASAKSSANYSSVLRVIDKNQFEKLIKELHQIAERLAAKP